MAFNIPVRDRCVESAVEGVLYELITLGDMLMAQLDDLKAGQADVNSKLDALNAKVDAFMAGLPAAVDLTEVIATEAAQGASVDAISAKIVVAST